MSTDIMILEDDINQSKVLADYIMDSFDDIHVHCFSSFAEAKEAVDSEVGYNVFMLDINIERVDGDKLGMELADYIRNDTRYKRTPIIFITGYPEHITTAINEIHCYSFITKPYGREDVISQLDEILNEDRGITIRTTGRVYVNVAFDDICYVESLGRYQYIHTIHGEEIKSRQFTLKEYAALLPKEFVKCHKSYIVNKNCIDNIVTSDKDMVLKHTGDKIPYTIDAKCLL